jgi:hypothetical protein
MVKNSEKLIDFWLAPIIEAAMGWLFEEFVILWGTDWALEGDFTMTPSGTWMIDDTTASPMFSSMRFDDSINMQEGDNLVITWSFQVS